MSVRDETSASAWADFCRRVAALGDQVQAEAPTPAAAAEGIHHLANQVACWLTYAIGHTDPAHPALFRSSDPVYQWGGPNADQVARRAAIDGTGSYRLVGSMGTCEEFVLQLKAGTAQSGGAGVAREVSASSLGLGPGDPIDVLLRAEPADGAWVALPPDTAFVHLRDYYFDWQPGDPAAFVLERVDDPGEPKPARTPERVAAMLADAAGEIEHSFAFWSGYQDRMLGGQAANTFTAPGGSAGGVQAITYAHAGVALAPDEALVVELDGDAAPLWDVQLYNRPWYEALDFAYRSTSTNHRMAGRNADGTVTVVIAARDTGASNWLDTESRPAVLATVRWWNAATSPSVRTRVVPAADVSGPVDPEQRRAQIRRRAIHAAWRYRT
jgi:Protein of unknown function (DUF1214)